MKSYWNLAVWLAFGLETVSLLQIITCLEIIPFGLPLTRLPENNSTGITATRDRDRSRYRHNFPINPLIRTASNNQTFAPVLWDLAPDSYPIDFFLFTKDNPYLAEELSVKNATDSVYFDRGKPTKIIIHDFMQSSENALIHDLKDAYMNRKESFNVILVDWEPARKYAYTVAVTVSEYVGKMTARLIQIMKLDPGKIHVIGFGLGAHAAGVMGNDLKIHANSTLARITGLDPSLPLFRLSGNYFKLDPEDAAFVDVIHTDGGDNLWNSNHLGMGQELGHVDIYPNRGIFQPGCRQSSSSLPSYEALHCSHSRAVEIYKESIEDEMSFVGCRCPSWTDFMESRCDCKHDANRIFVGEACSVLAPRGNYYLITKEGSPFGMGGRGVIPSLSLIRTTDPGIAMQNLFSVNGSFIQGISQIASIFTAPIKPFLSTLVRGAASISNNNQVNVTNNPLSLPPQEPNNNDNIVNEIDDPGALFPPPLIHQPPNYNNEYQNFQQDNVVTDGDDMAYMNSYYHPYHHSYNMHNMPHNPI